MRCVFAFISLIMVWKMIIHHQTEFKIPTVLLGIKSLMQLEKKSVFFYDLMKNSFFSDETTTGNRCLSKTTHVEFHFLDFIMQRLNWKAQRPRIFLIQIEKSSFTNTGVLLQQFKKWHIEWFICNFGFWIYLYKVFIICSWQLRDFWVFLCW